MRSTRISRAICHKCTDRDHLASVRRGGLGDGLDLGVVLLLTLPIVALFMVLAGQSAQRRTDHQWRSLARMSNHFLDVVDGLTTLRVFGRARAQRWAVQSVTDEYRRTTMGVLRLSFLSSFVLDLFASLSVAVVAVQVGLRLIGGSIELEVALIVLLLAPEAFQPLRTLGASYHAAAEGKSVSCKILDLLEDPAPQPAGRTACAPAMFVAVDHVSVLRADSATCAPAPTSFELSRSELVALVGPSGCGKSTLLGVMLGFVAPSAGAVWMDDVSVAQAERQSWLDHIAWMPQRPTLVADTVADNVRLGAPDATDDEVASAMAAACCEGLDLRRRIANMGRSLRWRAPAHRTCAVLPARHAGSGSPPAGRAHCASRRADRTARASCDTSVQRRPFRADGCAPTRCDRRRRPNRRDRRGDLRRAAHDAHEKRGAVMRRLLGLAHPGAESVLRGMWHRDTCRGCGIGLIASAAWLISAASLHPHIAALTLAIVGVRAFALGKSALRYLERLVSHDIAFRMLGDIRTRFVAALEPLSPGALPRITAAISFREWCPMSTDCRTCRCGCCNRCCRDRSCRIGCRCRRDLASVLGSCPGCLARARSGRVPAATSWANRRAETRLAKAGRTVDGCRHAAEREGRLVAYGARSAATWPSSTHSMRV
jgi:ATP-binding cassette subfamily C protein CydCD